MVEDAEAEGAAGSWVCEDVPWSGDLGDAVVADWRRVLATIPGATVASYPEWTSLACRAGVVRPWRVLLIRRGDVPVGVIPLCRPAPWRVEVMAPLSPDCPPVLMRPDAEDGAWAAVAQWLRRRGGVRALVAGRVDEARASACGRGAGVAVIARPCTPRMVVPVPAEWDAYLAALGSNTRSGIRKMARQFIEETPDAAFEVLTDVQACAPMLDRLIELHRRRWRHTPAGSVFESAAMARFYHDLVAWASGQGLASIACLRCGAQVLAAHVMFHAPGDDTLYSHLIGRDPDANHPKCHGPGNLINALTVRWAMAHGYRQYDLSFGNVSQKEQIGAAPMPLFELELARTAGEAALLHGTHSAWGHMRQWPRAVRCAWHRDGRA